MSKIIIYIMIFFSLLAGIDKIIGCKLGLGKYFEEGFKSMGSLSLVMLGIYSMAPVIGEYLLPLINPISKLMNIDPSIFIGTILAPDMGGYNTAMIIASNERIGLFSGLILSSTLGATIVFTIPIAISIIPKKDYAYFTKGALYGFITVPIGSFFTGVLMKIPMNVLLVNLIPPVFISMLITISISVAPEKTFKLFSYFGKLIVSISMIGLLISILDFVIGIRIIEGLISLEEGFIVVGKIAIILSGAYPLIHLVSKLLSKSLSKIGDCLNINETAVLGLISCLANSIPTLTLFKDMDYRGKIINSAFMVSAAFTFGGQLGFVSGVNNTMVTPFIIGKLFSGIVALVLAHSMTPKESLEMKPSLTSINI